MLRILLIDVPPCPHFEDLNDCRLLQIAGADEHRPVRLRAAGKIFAARFLFYGRAVGSESRQLVFPISPKSSSSASLLIS